MRIIFILEDSTAPPKTRKPGVIGPIDPDVFPPFPEPPGVFRGSALDNEQSWALYIG
jgi:hypothetical protein